jgi:hypothetical protein
MPQRGIHYFRLSEIDLREEMQDKLKELQDEYLKRLPNELHDAQALCPLYGLMVRILNRLNRYIG